MKLFWTLFLLACALPDCPAAASPALPARASGSKPLPFTGVNIAGGEFDHLKPGGTGRYGTDYTFPTPFELDYFAGKGVNIIRLPFRWEDLQPRLGQPLDLADLGRLQAVVSDATRRGMVVILDPHNYARHYDKLVGSADVPNAAFADFWGRLAGQFKDNPRVWLGLINEPYGVPPGQWLQSANAAIGAIRKAGARNLILVPGVAYSGAHSWIASGNGAAMLHVKDPAHHFVFDVHQYLDEDSSGTKPDVVSATIGSERLAQFTLWCRQHHQRGFLGEFAAGDTPTGRRAVEDMLTFMEKNRDVWAGYTWWAAGAWWGDYMFSVEPKNGTDAPLLSLLTPHLQPRSGPDAARRERHN